MKKINNTSKALKTFKEYIGRSERLKNVKNIFEEILKYGDIPSLSYIYQNLLKDNYYIFTCDTDEIKTIKDKLNDDTIYQNLFEQYKISSDKENKQPSELFKAFCKLITFFIHSYDNFVDSKMPYEIMTDLGVRACPYCNLNYIDAVITSDNRNNEVGGKKKKISSENKILRHHLDHFFPKAEYPLFALSFYNLIPSCYECNSPLKGDNIIHIPVNPYVEDYDRMAKFEIEYNKNPKHIKISDIRNLDDFEIKIKVKDNSFEKKIKEHNKLFELETRYKYRKDYALEVLKRKDFFTDDMIEEITRRMLIKKYPKKSISSIIWGNFVDFESINKRPLSKLTKDILEQNISVQEDN